ncbi:DNA cytosine methyltransferase [Chloroflexota bacterium]
MNGKLRFIDLFAGCGGLSLGLEQAGFVPILFSEINKDAATTYMKNRELLDLKNYADVSSLTNTELRNLLQEWHNNDIDDIDLICGGPPCQGYSGIGIRRTFKLEKHEIPSNHLFNEMVRIITFIRPKVFLFENVRGLLNSKWTSSGENGEIFRDVLTTLLSIPKYYVRWQLLYSKDYGIPQNRPRVIVIGIRKDVSSILPITNTDNYNLPKQSAVEDGLLPIGNIAPPDPYALLSDLIDDNYYGKKATDYYLRDPLNDVQRYLRTCPDDSILKEGDPLTEQEYSQHSERIRQKFIYMINNDGRIPNEYRTKKFSQRVIPKYWGAGGPNITATSLPDDYVHFMQPRSLTVREWARIQTFPDWYQFYGSRTTGGRRRAGDPSNGNWSRDVPKYTQIGNAVPVQLANAIGEHIKSLLGINVEKVNAMR